MSDFRSSDADHVLFGLGLCACLLFLRILPGQETAVISDRIVTL
ncbi:Uncharacterized protein dnm_030430 [Desulfonema magnum]|uniref:Uncharacterized protein n=1 Tax=Desulfonema magnum TaxID=45655 RepID=A0A975BK73_9BACT|nr:Uncharacterized protein dnm_030430 [Desulfonema magnum]